MQTNNLRKIIKKVDFDNQKTNEQDMENQMLCSCGCKQKIKWNKYQKYAKTKLKYIHGHNNKNKTYEELYGADKSTRLKELRSKARKGKLHSKESILKMSLANKGKHYSPKTEFKGKRIAWNKNKKLGDLFSKEKVLEIKKKIRVARLNQILPLKDTLLEKLVQDKLKELNINFITHSNVKNIAQPDIFIEPNICIFIDGCYWHGCEKCFDRNKISEWIKLRKIKDILITQKLIEDNYIVLRLWEHEIKNDIDLCLLQIKEKLGICYTIKY